MGYATALFGKWHLGGDRPEGREPSQQGFDEYYGIPRTSNEAQTTIAQGQTAPGTSFLWEGKAGAPARNVKPFDMKTRRTVDREAADRSVAFMERQARARRPFFLYYPMTQIHFPTLAHPDFAGKSGAGDVGDAMAEMDANVGRVLDAIDKLGIARNTIVLWCTDNGPEQRRPWRGSPGPWSGFYNSVMEGGIRTPCIIRWPGRIPAGRVSNEIVHQVDLFPTFAAAVGADIVPKDRAIDGVNQLPFLEGKQTALQPRPRHLLHQHAAARRQVARLEAALRVHARGGGAAGAAADASVQPALRSEGGDRHQGRESVGGRRHRQDRRGVHGHDRAVSRTSRRTRAIRTCRPPATDPFH